MKELTPESFAGVDIALFSAGGGISLEFAKHAVDAGAVVIDNSSAFRMDTEVPLVVPEVNASAAHEHKGIIANPNCTTIVTLMGLAPLHREWGVKNVIASSYQAVSGSGAQGIAELEAQVKAIAAGESIVSEVYPKQIAFNVIPQVDAFLETGYTKEEMKMENEGRKILGVPEFRASVTCVRVPVFKSHSVAVTAQFGSEPDVAKARELIAAADGVQVVDDPANLQFPTPLDSTDIDDCLVGRLRKDIVLENALTFWVVGDQVRKGAALNAVQIAELSDRLARWNSRSMSKETRKVVESDLRKRVPRATARPATLHKAMRHSLFAGGKRLRPILCVAAAEACGGTTENALPLAAAVECIHTYSLIHDDLPSMDDDDFRRGVPTCHTIYGEGIAVLAGDALQALAFELVAGAKATRRYTVATMVSDLAVTSGSLHLIGGQVMDMEGEGAGLGKRELKFIHESKTAALLRCSLRLGGMSANATPKQLDALSDFGYSLGLAFQVIDDILDVTQTTEKLGKSAGKDVAAGKATYPAIYGLEASRKQARRLTKNAVDALGVFGRKGDVLRAFADYMLNRDY